MLNLLNEAKYKFVIRKQNIANDNSKANFMVNSEIIFNAEVLKSNICDCNDAYI